MDEGTDGIDDIDLDLGEESGLAVWSFPFRRTKRNVDGMAIASISIIITLIYLLNKYLAWLCDLLKVVKNIRK
jgi:hypothetical protein